MNVIDFCLDLLAPQACRGCGELGCGLCVNCKNDLLDEKYPFCSICNKASDSGLCTKCRKSSNCSQIFVVGGRKGSLKTLLNDYKFKSSRSLSKDIVDLLDKSLPILHDDTVVTSIPTIPSHIRQRGFDHAKLIAKGLARKRKLHYDGQLLLRQNNSVQVGTSARQRKIQAEQAFCLNSEKKVPGKILLIDDIITTSSTVLSASKLLKSAGCENIIAAVVARQELDDVLKY